jgi:hypothetical protein
VPARAELLSHVRPVRAGVDRRPTVRKGLRAGTHSGGNNQPSAPPEWWSPSGGMGLGRFTQGPSR